MGGLKAPSPCAQGEELIQQPEISRTAVCFRRSDAQKVDRPELFSHSGQALLFGAEADEHGPMPGGGPVRHVPSEEVAESILVGISDWEASALPLIPPLARFHVMEQRDGACAASVRIFCVVGDSLGQLNP